MPVLFLTALGDREATAPALEAEGYEVVSVGSGEEALALLDKQRIDIVILDVLMPGLGGFETCRRIRKSVAHADMPVLFLTALGDREATAPALEAGGDDLLPKPFHRAELMMRVRALIRQRRTTGELKDALRTLAEQNEALRQIEQDRRKLAQLIVHDLRGPISAVIANAELIKRRAAGDIAEMIGDVLVAAEHLDRTAHDMLDLSRAEEAALTPELETFPLAELVSEATHAIRGLARWSGATIEVDVEEVEVVADREMFRRLLQNLVHNAVKHAPGSTPVRIVARCGAEGLSLRVTDCGPGVPPDDIDRIFDRFAKAPKDSKRTRGYGLGLAFCRLAAEAHGGKIWIEQPPGSGVSFCVRIPQPSA
jgi:signal transduction histidine kinase